MNRQTMNRSSGIADYKSRNTTSVAWVLGLLLVVALAMPSLALPVSEPIGEAIDEDGWYTLENSWFYQTEAPYDTSFTVHSVVETGSNFTTGVEQFYPVGLSTEQDGEADLLRVVWALDPNSWGFVWSLEIVSDVVSFVDAGGNELDSVELAKVFPVAGHEYETYLSYEPEAGAISLSLIDLTDGKVIYQGAHQTESYDGQVWPAVGLQTADGTLQDNLAQVRSFGSVDKYMPVGAEWAVGTRASSGSLLPARRFDLDEDVVVRLTNPAFTEAGQFHVTIVHDGVRQPFGEFTELSDVNEISVPVEQLPLGQYDIQIEYVEDDKVILADSQTITVGKATFRVRDIEIDREAQEVRGTLQISAVEDISDIQVEFAAFLNEQIWNQEDRSYSDKLYETYTLLDDNMEIVSEDAQTFTFAIPLPEHEALYELSFAPVVKPDISTETIGGRKLFTTYKPADPKPGEGYAIAVLPDTQNYAKSHQTIYIRHVHWIAENAADKNILLMLHLGDITNDNTPLQWQRSVEALTLLDGVMPYMLSQGNHDMTEYGGGQAATRTGTLMNEYFPVENLPWVEGTFPEGRIENNYATFDLQGDKYLIISLEFGPRDEALDWANEVAAAHPDHKIIMITHAYTARHGGRSNHATGYPIATNPDTTVNGGDAMFVKFLSQHENVFMTLSGHHDAHNAITRSVSRGRHGNVIYDIMSNYQFDVNGGNGFFPLFEFRTDGTIEVRSYSPYLDEYRDDISDAGFDNHFIIDTNTYRYLSPPKED